MPPDPTSAPDDGIYRTILIVLVASLILGAIVALAGDLVLDSPGLSQAGTWLVLASGGAYLFFRVLGAREARKRARREAEGKTEGNQDEP